MRSLKVLLSFVFTILAITWFAEPAHAATITAPTSISANTTWTSDNVYVISSYTVIQPGVQLTIQPGTVVKFQGSAYMNVKGTLDASGTSDNNIIFTSYKDDEYGGDTNGDGTVTTPAKGNRGKQNILF